MHLQFWLVRHGETEWSASARHTGRTDLPLTLDGKLHARQIAVFLGSRVFALVLTSPLQRARETCQLAARAQMVIERALSSSGDVLVFAHGHILRVLAACWLGLPPEAGRLFALGTASVSILGYEHDTRVITQWNGGAKERGRPRIKMASSERSNQSATEGTESEQRALASGDSAGDLEFSETDTELRK
jgi:probable phosphoglycerate mutase